jgi:peptidase M28-like protein
MQSRLIASLVAASFVLVACTGSPAAVPTPGPSSPSPSPSAPSPAGVRPGFDVTRAVAHDRMLSVTIGPREAGSAAYRRAASYAETVLTGFGYRVTRQNVPLPAGKSQGTPVPAATTQNIIAAPPGYNPAKAHLIVGAHLDTVVPSPGGNDNSSGAATLLELARLASLDRTAMPIVWIEFGGEERRRPGVSGATFGSRYYLSHLSTAERRAVHGMLTIDMVGRGPVVYVCHESLTGDGFVDALLSSGKRLHVRAQKRVVVGFFSDHSPFEHAGIVVAWLWTGEDARFHTSRDTFANAQPAAIARTGRIAWDTLRSLRL